jgi:hypothetical protein
MTAPGYWTRRFFAASIAIGAVSVLLILHFTGYPFEPWGFWIVEFHLRTQDLAGAALLVAILLAAWTAPERAGAAALAAVDAIARHPWRVAAATFVALCLGAVFVEHNHPLAQDEYAAVFQSRIFAAGRLTGEFPPELVARLVPYMYLNNFIYGSWQTGAVASAYWPGFALLLAPFTFLGLPWACNPLLAAAALVAIARVAGRLSADPRAPGWAMLLALASPAFGAMAITYFSMTAHLLFNLLFVWLLLERSPRRLFLAGVVGSFALVLHNPVPHALFAFPWIVWLALQPQRYRHLGALAAGYAVFAPPLGLGWALLLYDIQGDPLYGLFPADGNALERIANFFWGWHIRMRSALAAPFDGVLAMRIAEGVRLWHWAVPGLPLLAAAGWWLGRRDPRVLLLGLSLACTLAGYLFVSFSQGHGWGARYVHPAWATLPVLGAVCLGFVRDAETEKRLPGYVALLALLSLALATPLRAVQIDRYIKTHLANRPAALPEGRQIVLVRPYIETYSADLVQNDPFLRQEVWYLLSHGSAADRALMRSRFPGARLVSEDRRGQVWLIAP